MEASNVRSAQGKSLQRKSTHSQVRPLTVARADTKTLTYDRTKRQSDGCGVRTHALSDWRLKPAP